MLGRRRKPFEVEIDPHEMQVQCPECKTGHHLEPGDDEIRCSQCDLIFPIKRRAPILVKNGNGKNYDDRFFVVKMLLVLRAKVPRRQRKPQKPSVINFEAHGEQ